MADDLIEDGFMPSSNNAAEYVSEINVDENFAYGLTIAECFIELAKSKLFVRDFVLNFSSEGEAAEGGKFLREKATSKDAVLALIENNGLDNFLYLVAANYDSELLEEAQLKRRELNDKQFLTWIKDNITPRSQGSGWKGYLIMAPLFENLSLEAVYEAFCFSLFEQREDFARWAEKAEANLYSALLENGVKPSDRIAVYLCTYLFFMRKISDIIFGMLNSQSVDYKIKGMMQTALSGFCSDDLEFGLELQEQYDAFCEVTGGRDIRFIKNIPTPKEKAMAVGKLPQELYYHELRQPIDERIFDRLYRFLVEHNYLEDNRETQCCLRLRVLGDNKYVELKDNKIRWHGSDKELSALVHEIAQGKGFYKKTEGFFVIVCANGTVRQYDSYDASNSIRSVTTFQDSVRNILK